MPRYIDADAELVRLERLNLGSGSVIKEFLTTAKTADVVEIVRCRDCKKHDWCSIEDLALNDETFFCKWGERREDD